jgi:hypothetical protein
MSSRLSPALADFAEGRWPEEPEMSQRRRYPRELHLPQLDSREPDSGDLEPRDMPYRDDLDPRSMEPPLHPSEVGRFERRHWRASLHRWVPVGLVRFMVIFFIGVGTTLAWQSYADVTGRMVSGALSRIGLGWMAPPAPAIPAAPLAAHDLPDLAALSRSLATVRESVDRLAADLAKLQTAKQDPPARTTLGPPASVRRPAQATR